MVFDPNDQTKNYSLRGSLEFEAGGEWDRQQAQPADQKTQRQWFSLGYRVFF
jgi:hypothetical protein